MANFAQGIDTMRQASVAVVAIILAGALGATTGPAPEVTSPEAVRKILEALFTYADI